MRRLDKKITSPGLIQQILQEAEICRVAFHDDEYPYIVPFSYGYENDTLFLHCAGEGKKLDLLRRNNRVCFEIEHSAEIVKGEQSCNWTMRYRSIIGYGQLEILADRDDKIRALASIMAHYGQTENEFDEALMERTVALKLSISSLTAKQSGKWD